MTNFGQLLPNLRSLQVSNQVPYYAPGSLSAVGLPPSAYRDASLSEPTNDWRLLDLFSTAFSPTATRGKLSVNQPNLAPYLPNLSLNSLPSWRQLDSVDLAAWSAVLSGVSVLTNTLDANSNAILLSLVIPPAGVYDPYNPSTWTPIVKIVDALNQARFVRTNSNYVFEHLGDLLSVPALTMASPFLNTNVNPLNGNYPLTDAAYERIPQQVLGLLKLDTTPRFVIYAWGQALKPAPHSVYTGSGPYFGMVTNYQIVSEVATRTVVRFDGAPSPLAYVNGTPPPINNLHPVIESFSVLPPD